jgi:ABC-type nitrate/sulfonate/bicarbonate transport system ATPase subunit
MIEIRNCTKRYPAPRTGALMTVLGGIDLTIADHEFVCVLGPSGCGKTTLLKIVAGLVRADEGEVVIDGRPVAGPSLDRAFVFQDFALLPWADVLDNIAFGLELRGWRRSDRLAVASDLVGSMGLQGFEHHLPSQLSGGMQQRVGLARALAVDPRILLMDEPFGSLDSMTRRLLQEDLTRIHQRTRKTVIFVTHSVDEAVRLGDRVVRLSPQPGRVEEIVTVDLPHPRAGDSAADRRFVEITEYLWSRIRAGRASEASAGGTTEVGEVSGV